LPAPPRDVPKSVVQPPSPLHALALHRVNILEAVEVDGDACRGFQFQFHIAEHLASPVDAQFHIACLGRVDDRCVVDGVDAGVGMLHARQFASRLRVVVGQGEDGRAGGVHRVEGVRFGVVADLGDGARLQNALAARFVAVKGSQHHPRVVRALHQRVHEPHGRIARRLHHEVAEPIVIPARDIDRQ
jgi:hypothetical protein